MKRFKRGFIDNGLAKIIKDIAIDTGKTKQESSTVVTDFLKIKQKDLNSFIKNNNKRRKYEIRF